MSIIEDLNQAKQRLTSRDFSLVLVSKGSIIFEGDRPGILDLWQVYENKNGKLTDCAAADRVVGKAAAAVMAAGGVAGCYGQVVSREAKKVFQDEGIIYEADIEVSAIKKPHSNELCPLEKLTGKVDNLDEALTEISRFLQDTEARREE